MARCNGKGYAECDSCINREFDPFECDSCDDASNYEPDESDEDADDGPIDTTIWLGQEEYA